MPIERLDAYKILAAKKAATVKDAPSTLSAQAHVAAVNTSFEAAQNAWSDCAMDEIYETMSEAMTNLGVTAIRAMAAIGSESIENFADLPKTDFPESGIFKDVFESIDSEREYHLEMDRLHDSVGVNFTAPEILTILGTRLRNKDGFFVDKKTVPDDATPEDISAVARRAAGMVVRWMEGNLDIERLDAYRLLTAKKEVTETPSITSPQDHALAIQKTFEAAQDEWSDCSMDEVDETMLAAMTNLGVVALHTMEALGSEPKENFVDCTKTDFPEAGNLTEMFKAIDSEREYHLEMDRLHNSVGTVFDAPETLNILGTRFRNADGFFLSKKAVPETATQADMSAIARRAAGMVVRWMEGNLDMEKEQEKLDSRLGFVQQLEKKRTAASEVEVAP